MGREHQLADNVNVRLEGLKNNVNVRRKRTMNRERENRIVQRIMAKLGPESIKDEAYWHKVAKTLSEDQIETGLEIGERKKAAGMQRIRYVGGIYANMMRA